MDLIRGCMYLFCLILSSHIAIRIVEAACEICKIKIVGGIK